MSLPLFQTSFKDLQLLQTNWSKQLNPVLAQPINQGTILTEVSLTTGDNTINTGLNRKLQGWIIIRQRALASIYDKQDNNSTPSQTLILNSSAAVVVDLLVF